MIPVYIIRWCN